MNSIIPIVLIIAAFNIAESAQSIFERLFQNLHDEPQSLRPGSVLRKNLKIKTEWIEQKMDHFDDKENATWKMRYIENSQYFEHGGPIFIFVGGEWNISPGNLVGGHMHDMAKEHKGYLYYTEHRYYGDSHPTKDLSTENLRYLHVTQALADLAHFIRDRKKTVPGLATSKVILTGGSYSATMVTWFKRLYPELAAGCWASSAPLYAKPDFFEYKEVTGESIQLVGGDACYGRIQNAIAELEEMIANERGEEVKELLNICDTFDTANDLDVWTLFSEISDIFAGVVQTHSTGQIEGVCKTILSEDDDLKGLIKYLRTQMNDKPCNDVSYKAAIESLSYTSWNKGNMRQWFYQTCNEYGWYQTSTSLEQPFGSNFPLELYIAVCADTYEKHFNIDVIKRKVSETNKMFGGLNPNVDDVYMTHGQLDPWRAMGIQDPNQAQIIPMHAHCKDLASISSSDTREMRNSKEKIAELVREWIKRGE